MNVELHSGTELHLGIELHPNVKLHSGAKLQNGENALSNSKVRTYGRDIEIANRDAHSDIEAKRQSARPRTEPILSKYVRRHHPIDQIIGDKDARPMTRRRSRNGAQ